MPHRSSRLFLPLALLSSLWGGCGDSLLGGDRLEDVLGLGDSLQDVAWQLRWVQASDQGLGVACDLLEPGWEAWIPDEPLMGTIEVPAPRVGEPALRIDEEAYSWGLALLVLVDQESLEALDAEALVEEQQAILELESGSAAWGVADRRALLFVEGDTGRFLSDLAVAGPPGEEPEALPEGLHWVELRSEVPVATESFVGALSLDRAATEGAVPALPVTHVEHLNDETWGLFTGEPLGGLESLACGEAE